MFAHLQGRKVKRSSTNPGLDTSSNTRDWVFPRCDQAQKVARRVHVFLRHFLYSDPLTSRREPRCADSNLFCISMDCHRFPAPQVPRNEIEMTSLVRRLNEF